MIDSLSAAVTGDKQPTLADIEQRSHELITQAGLHSQHQTGPASQEPAPQPEHSGQAVFEQYALYGLAGEAVRALATHTEAQPEAILLQLLDPACVEQTEEEAAEHEEYPEEETWSA